MRPPGLRDEDLPAAFWEALPLNEDNADLAAIRALEAESTPDERAENYKVQGNEALKRGVQLRKRFYVQDAVDRYSKGIDLHPNDQALLAALYSNRSQAQIRLANHRRALDDAVQAAKLDPGNIKTFYRGAQAALHLMDFEKAYELCQQGLQLFADNPDLTALAQRVQERRASHEQETRQRAAEAMAQRMPHKRLALALIKRGWQIGRPQLHIGDRKPYLDEQSRVHWPVLFMYPEPMQMDAVEDVLETDPLSAHLDVMFPPEGHAQAPEWDAAHAYKRHALQMYYLSYAAQPLSLAQLTEVMQGGWPDGMADEGPSRYGPRAAHWVAVQEQSLLADVLSCPDYVVPGIPVLFVVVSGSQFERRFLADESFLL